MGNIKHKVAGVVAGTRAKAAAVGTTAMVAAGSAMAGGGGSGFDPSEITSKIVEYTGYGVTLIGAYALGRWSLRAMGLIK